MAAARAGSKLRVELAGHKPGVIGKLNHFHQTLVLRPARNHHSLGLELWHQRVVHFIPMSMTFSNDVTAVDLTGLRAVDQIARL